MPTCSASTKRPGYYRTHDSISDYHPKLRTSHDEALADDVSGHAENCRCDSCKALRIQGKTEDSHMVFLRNLNRANRRAHGID